MKLAFLGLLAFVLVAAAAPSLYDKDALPQGPVGESIRYGHDIVFNTPQLMKGYVNARLTCADCHVNGGTKARGGSFLGTYARFPQWNARAKRVIMLNDRIAECFLYSMNGRPPAYNSKEMIAILAYIAWIGRGTPVGASQDPSDRFLVPVPSTSPDLARGRQIYSTLCSQCHQANGGGIAESFPPLWGASSFNNGAGMAHIDRMAGFVHYNMPQNDPGSLSLQDAYDVSAWILTQPRPTFDPARMISQSPDPASYF